MAGNENEPLVEGDLTVMDGLARELRVGISLAEGEVQRLVGRIFANQRRAERGLHRLNQRGGVEHTISVLEKDSLARTWHFGALQIGLIPWRRRTVAAALAELPDALRKLQHLLDRQQDLTRARQAALRRGPRFTPDDEPPPTLIHKRGRRR